MTYIIGIFFGYLLGSVPTAYILVKKFSDLDVREAGSGNVGALNSYEVSGSKLVGIIVLLIDILKGFLPVFILKTFFDADFLPLALTVLASVLAHNYSPWLKFKGGRGLATAAGATIYFTLPLLVTWIVMWVIAFLMKRNVHFGNIWATILTGLLAISSGRTLNLYSFPPAEKVIYFIIFSLILMILILLKHLDVMGQLFKQQIKSFGSKNEKE